MAFFIFLIYLATLFFLVMKSRWFRLENLNRFIPPAFLLIKLMAATLLVLVYSEYYADRNSADIFRFFDDGLVITEAFKENPPAFFRLLAFTDSNDPLLESYILKMKNWDMSFDYGMYVDNRTIIRLNGILGLVTFGYYPTHVLLFTFFSFCGSILLYKSFYPSFENKNFLLACVIFLPPSFLIWSSGILKESILVAGMGLLCFGVIRMNRVSTVLPAISALGGLCLLLLVKIYVLIFLLPLLIVFRITRNNLQWSKRINFSFVLFGMILFFLSPKLGFDLPGMIVRKHQDSVNEAMMTEAGSMVRVQKLENQIGSFIKKTPEALINSMLRPFPWEADHPLSLMVSLENLFFLLLLSVAVFKGKTDKHKIPLLLLLLLFSFLIFMLAGMVTPVLGTLVRYRSPALPFIYMSFLLVIDFKKIKPFPQLWIKKQY